MVDEDCTFCDIWGQHVEARAVENTVLAAHSDFHLIAALGPLTTPHLLAVSQQHLSDMRRAAHPISARYEAFRRHTIDRFALTEALLVEIEHGPSVARDDGPCINHAHVHWLFTATNLVSFLKDRLPSVPAPNAGSYIWIRQGTRESVLDSSALKGRRLRELLGEALGVEEPDWALNPMISDVRTTVRDLMYETERYVPGPETTIQGGVQA